jgi:hypothetical protein
MDAVQRGNARLRELGYSPDEAAIEPTGSPTRLQLAGSLLRSGPALCQASAKSPCPSRRSSETL